MFSIGLHTISLWEQYIAVLMAVKLAIVNWVSPLCFTLWARHFKKYIRFLFTAKEGFLWNMSLMKVRKTNPWTYIEHLTSYMVGFQPQRFCGSTFGAKRTNWRRTCTQKGPSEQKPPGARSGSLGQYFAWRRGSLHPHIVVFCSLESLLRTMRERGLLEDPVWG